MMGMALALSRRSLGRTWPNPAVGCVLVKDGAIVGRGRTRDGGRPHAEADALSQAGAAARGATAGVLLVSVPLRGDYITPTVLGGASGSMVGQMVAAQFQSAQNWALGAAMAVLLMLAIFGTSAVVGGLLKAVGLIATAMTSLKIPAKEAE